ncbi:hypothetical protein ABT039_24690 [Streptomyces lasiicapitis]|uniref:hypothetical protein n=1 Tax=Streptomyces TaxID=1883 RepID=UPI0013DD0147|nr:hypothetical protein [Streptomyces aureoverticillatus]QIB48098.1 hypothetical protein G3H79_38550 [Streptomyces aureoverticillatus]
MIQEKLDVLSQMMAEHMAMPFPPGFRGLDIEDQDMVMLGANAYGYALGVLNGPLDEQRGKGLIRLTTVFEKVLPAIDGEYAAKYYTHVRDLAVLAAEIETLRERKHSGQEGSPGLWSGRLDVR